MQTVFITLHSLQLAAIVYLAVALARARERIARIEGRMNGRGHD